MECGKPAQYRCRELAYRLYLCRDCYPLHSKNKDEWEPLALPEQRIPASKLGTEQILAERGKVYGDVSDNMVCAMEVMRVLKKHIEKNRSFEDIGGMREYDTYMGCMSMIVHKIARAVTGNIFYEDNYVDIAGYAKLLQDKMREYAANSE